MKTIKMLQATATAIFVLSLLFPIQGLAQWEVEVVAQGGNGNGWAMADFNGDDAVDLTYNDLANQQVFWFENSPSGWNANLIDGLSTYNETLVSGGFSWDIDQDGDQDIIFLQFTSPSTLLWYENVLDGVLWIKNVISDDIGFLTNMTANLADFDGDDDTDIAIIDNNNGMVMWFENTGGAINWTKHDIAPLPPFQGRWITVMDVDGDADADVVVTTNDSSFYFENQLPQATWTKTIIGEALDGSYFGRGADVDNDGDLDLITSGFNSGQVAWYDNPSWELRTIADNVPEAFVGAVGDLDNDGDVDVAAGETGGMAWFENLDNGMRWQRWTIATGAENFLLPMGGADQHGPKDLNQDGLIDIAATTYNPATTQGELRWYVNPGVTSAVDDKAGAEMPDTYHLAQNYPNPFNPLTIIQYELPHPSQVTLAIYNLLGERVRTLVDAKESAGIKQIAWDGRDGKGQHAAGGVYLYRLQAGTFVETRKAIFLK